MPWVLKVVGLGPKESYFKQMTGIGPMCTPHLKEAARFKTREDAVLSPAFRFPLTSFFPELTLGGPGEG